MTIKYVGNRAFRDRLAEITYTDEEEERAEKIFSYLREKGYAVDSGVMNWAGIPVADHNEYEILLDDWKEAKRTIKK